VEETNDWHLLFLPVPSILPFAIPIRIEHEESQAELLHRFDRIMRKYVGAPSTPLQIGGE
jgi:hypothetical protein